MDENKSISISAVLQALGSKSNNDSLLQWKEGRKLMPIATLLRFCNAFQVPISAFICDTEANSDEPALYVAHEESDKWEPEGGYVTARHPGNRAPLDPTDVEKTKSIIPGCQRLDIEKEEGYIGSDETKIDNRACKEEVGLNYGKYRRETNIRCEAADLLALIDLEQKYHTRCVEMLSIIEKQRKQIASLTDRLLADSMTKGFKPLSDVYGESVESVPQTGNE